jgi:septum site-determining protein MinD
MIGQCLRFGASRAFAGQFRRFGVICDKNHDNTLSDTLSDSNHRNIHHHPLGASVKAQSIVVTSGKGGVGKTTTTANIGMALASLGEKVAVIDVDVGLRNLDVVMGLEGRVVYDLVDVLEGKCKLRQALIRDKRVETLYLLPASQTRDKDSLSEAGIRELVQRLIEEEGMTRVLLDSPAGIESGFRTAAAPAQGALIVVNPEVSSVRDADRIIGMLEAANVRENRLVINRIRPKMVARKDMLSVEDIVGLLGTQPIGIIPEDEEILISTNVGTPIVLDRSKTKAGIAFRDTARRIRGEEVPFATLEEKQGFFANIARMFGRE